MSQTQIRRLGLPHILIIIPLPVLHTAASLSAPRVGRGKRSRAKGREGDVEPEEKKREVAGQLDII